MIRTEKIKGKKWETGEKRVILTNIQRNQLVSGHILLQGIKSKKIDPINNYWGV